MWPHNSNGRSKFLSRRLPGAAAQSCERPFGASLILGAVHAFDPFLSRFAGFEGISEILCLVCNLCSVELQPGVGQELQGTKSKSNESGEIIEDIPTVKEGKDHE